MGMEDSGFRMMKKTVMLVAGLLLLFALSGMALAEEEEPVPATPTDLTCPHEHTREIIYFYDTPAYASAGAASHHVSGPAVIRTVCLDCDEVLDSRETEYAEELRPHSMKRGVCALCGYREPERAEMPKQADRSGERTFYARDEGQVQGLLSLTLTKDDLRALNNAGVQTALVRGKTGLAAVALDVPAVLTRVREEGADLYTEIAEQEDGSFFAAVNLLGDKGKRIPLKDGGIRILLFRENRGDVRIALAASDSGELEELDGEWNEQGYWVVVYTEEGTYFVLQ